MVFMKLRMLIVGLMVACLSQACIDIEIHTQLRADGGGTMTVSYAVVEEMINGEFAELSTNELLPLTESDIKAMAAKLDGVRVVSSSVNLRELNPGARFENLRVVTYKLAFDDIDDIAFDHVWFGYYPWGDSRYFQFVIHKDTSGPQMLMQDNVASVNPLAHMLLKGRTLKLTAELPGKVINTNASSLDWSTVTWTIPLRSVLSDTTEKIVTWARTPSLPGDGLSGYLDPVLFLMSGQFWRMPGDLPATIVDGSAAAPSPAPAQGAATHSVPTTDPGSQAVPGP